MILKPTNDGDKLPVTVLSGFLGNGENDIIETHPTYQTLRNPTFSIRGHCQRHGRTQYRSIVGRIEHCRSIRRTLGDHGDVVLDTGPEESTLS